SRLGGFAMRAALRLARLSRSSLPALLSLPLLVSAGAAWLRLPSRLLEVTRAVEVNAPPAVVWKQIVEARDIRAEELPLTIAHVIGVPKPLEGVNQPTPQGEVRFSKWERGVAFLGHVTRKIEPESIAWRYAFEAHSFPPGSMD